MDSLGSSKLFGLVIGINEYPNTEYPSLKGCVADANAVEAYLQSTLSVPERQIISLRNERATRSAIIEGFRGLKDDVRIRFGDPILIYFAGHGGLASCPEGWPCNSDTVQMIIPYDCGQQLDGKIIHGIPDLTIGWHLKCLADSKGDNITVIFDNCFSGSGTRSLNNGTASSHGIRGSNYRVMLPKTLDNLHHIRFDGEMLPRRNNERGISVASGYSRSHILLAACQSNEYAREVGKRGVFTKALLETLGRSDVTKITYKELLERMPQLPSDQNPQLECESSEQDRIIFSTRRVTRTIGNPELFQSTRPILYVYVSQELRNVVDAIAQMPGIALWQTSDSPARIAVTLEARQIYFYIHDIEMNHYGLQKLSHPVPYNARTTDFQRIFHRISNYEYYLRHIKGTRNLEGRILLEFFRLKPKATQAGYEDWNLGEIDADNLAICGTINIVQDRSYYVVKLTNKTNEHLFPSLFYFDNCDYSINSLYEPPITAPGKKVDPPLKAGKSMIIGYGSEGVTPFVVGLREPYNIEVGFLKLFISTQNVDYSHIRQESPFNYSGSASRGLRPYVKQNDYCGSIMVPLAVQSQSNPYPAILETGLSGSLHRSLTSQPRPIVSGPRAESSVFKMVRIDGHHPTFQKLRDMMKTLMDRRPHLHIHSLSDPFQQQFTNLRLSDDSYLHEALHEVQKMGERIAELGDAVSHLKSERGQSSQELVDLDRHLHRIELKIRPPSSTTG